MEDSGRYGVLGEKVLLEIDTVHWLIKNSQKFGDLEMVQTCIFIYTQNGLNDTFSEKKKQRRSPNHRSYDAADDES